MREILHACFDSELEVATEKNRPVQSSEQCQAGSSLLLEPPFGTRSALAVVVPTRCSSLQLVFVLVSLLLNFHLIIFLCWRSSVKHQHGIAARAPRAAGRPRGAAARRIGSFAANQPWCSNHFLPTCCTCCGLLCESVELHVHVDVLHDGRSTRAAASAADDGAWRRTVRERRHLPALHPHSLLAEPTCRGGSAGGCLCASTSSSSQGARDGSNPATHGERARADVMCVCVLSSRQGH